MRLAADPPEVYLGADEVIDVDHPTVAALADRWRDATDSSAYARLAYTHVRDAVRHSWDADDPQVTVRASEVAAAGVGLCHAKSHLLVALLRSRGVPAGLCYQRLVTGDGFMLHGLVAVHLGGRWHRLDPRGNNPGVDAQFSLDREQLAWPVRSELGEVDYPVVYAAPDPAVVAAMRAVTDIRAAELPDRLA